MSEFLDIPRYKLTQVHINNRLARKELEGFAKKYKFDWEKIEEKGYWALVRGLFKGELNNAKNFPIQALAGHITNRSMLDVMRSFKESNLDGWVSLQVHDEVTCYVPTEQAEEGADYLRKGMEENIYAKLLDIDMIADPIVCTNLKDAK